jgi:hypothetical protein
MELAEAREELAAARVVMAAAPAADAVIHAVDDEDDEEGEGASAEVRALLASFESLPEDAGRRQALVAEAKPRGDALGMRRVYVRSDLTTVTCMGRDHTRIDRENRELRVGGGHCSGGRGGGSNSEG